MLFAFLYSYLHLLVDIADVELRLQDDPHRLHADSR
jgi:hypothetical protein